MDTHARDNTRDRPEVGLDRIQRLFAGRRSGSGLEGLEDAGAQAQPDFSDGSLKDRLDGARAELKRIVKMHLGNDPAAHQLVDELVRRGDRALRMLRDGDPALTGANGFLGDLEVIARTDGSRPSFMVKNGAVDLSSSPIGDWGPSLAASDASGHLEKAISCVGRIDDPAARAGFQGTGFLIAENLIVTNRHVLQVVADQDNEGAWRFHRGAKIDFGHEFNGRDSVMPRALKSVVFVGPDPITSPVVHSRLDLVLIEIAPLPAGQRAPYILPLDIAPAWAADQTRIYTIGYPAQPDLLLGYSPTLLEQLFKSTFGFKRLAPGEIIRPVATSTAPWTLAHDATTLGGNSGSIVVVIGREINAAGLHYGGRLAEPRENWGHVLGRVLDVVDARKANKDVSLRACLSAHGVVLVNPFQPAAPPT